MRFFLRFSLWIGLPFPKLKLILSRGLIVSWMPCLYDYRSVLRNHKSSLSPHAAYAGEKPQRLEAWPYAKYSSQNKFYRLGDTVRTSNRTKRSKVCFWDRSVPTLLILIIVAHYLTRSFNQFEYRERNTIWIRCYLRHRYSC